MQMLWLDEFEVSGQIRVDGTQRHGKMNLEVYRSNYGVGRCVRRERGE